MNRSIGKIVNQLQIPKYAIEYILEVEGGLSDNPNDKGGLTNYGISTGLFKLLKQKDLDFLKDKESVKDLTIEDAIRIYDYLWRDNKIPERYHYPIDLVMFDSYVQHNPRTVVRTAQRALNVVVNDILKVEIPPLVDDGILGKKTLAHFNIVQTLEHAKDLFCLEMITRRSYLYYRIVISDPTQEEFLAGWIKRLNILHNTIYSDGRG